MKVVRPDAFTPGPWIWDSRAKDSNDGRSGRVYTRLVTPDRGMLLVMDFRRMGMQGAIPVLRDSEGFMAEAHEFFGPPDHNRVVELLHPDALLIAAAPDLYVALDAIAKSGPACNAMHEPHVPGCEWCAARAALRRARGRKLKGET